MICADDTDERLQKKSLLDVITSQYHPNGICRSVGTSPRLRMSLQSNATQRRAFLEFVDERNQLVHSHVYSEPDGSQQLIYQGKDKTRTWSLAEINDLAHRFENSSIVLRDLMKEIWNI
jgi:hypothetical protein